MVERGTQELERQIQNAPAVKVDAREELSQDERRGASALATQAIERPAGAIAPSEDMLKAFQPEVQTNPEPASATTGPGRSVNELAQDAAVRAALQQALDSGAIKYDSLKKVVAEGLQTGTFTFKSEGQERVIKGLIADAIKPAPAQAMELPAPEPTTPSPEPEAASAPSHQGGSEGRDPNALIKEGGKYDEAIKAAIADGRTLPAPANDQGYTRAEAQDMSKQGLIHIPETIAIDEAIKHVGEKLGSSFDPIVGEMLAADPAIRELKNATDSKAGFQAARPAVSDAVRYANQIAVKTGDFEPESIKASFSQAFGQPTRKDLIGLAEGQGINLYPDSQPPRHTGGSRQGSSRDKDAPVVVDGLYDRAIKAALAEGKELPAPTDPAKGYTTAEANQLVKDKLISLEERAQARQTPGKSQELPLASRDDARAVIDYLNGGHGKDGARGLPFDTYKQLGRKAQNEVAVLVKALNADPQANLPVTTFLAKDFKEKVFAAQPA